MSKGGEETFHQRYEEAIENIKPEFGRRYTMIIGGKNIKSSETFVHISPIDTRIVLAYFQCGTAKHTENAIKVAKKAFESWGKTDYNKRIKICRNAVDIMIRRKFELAALIVTENADLDKAIEGILKAAFSYSGQKCSACSRVYVQKRIKDKFVERLVEKTKNLPIGNPLESNTFMGPLINSNAYKNYQKYIKLAFRDGMVLAGGGFIKKDDNFKYGYYVEPTIVDGLPKNHRLFREELFMPILCITDYDDFDKAIELCNQSDYGLTAGIYSNKKEEIDKFLDNIESGVIYVNRNISATTGAMVGCQSFGGWKDSGTTGKGTGGPYYLTQFMREQSQTYVV